MSEDVIDAVDETQDFRTHEEMHRVYEQRHADGALDEPYVVARHAPERYFGFIGSAHTNDPSDQQWGKIFEEWEKFLQSPNPNKIVFNEGNAVPESGKTREEAIREGADNGTAAWLAQQAGVQCVSPEPKRAEEIESLKTDYGYSEDKIMAYYLGRQMGQWFRYDHEKGKTLEEYVEDVVGSYKKAYPWQNEYTTESVTQLVEAVTGKRLAEGTPEDYAKIADPSMNKISSDCSHIRDLSIFRAVRRAWDQGKDVFCVYGSGHAIVMEPALRKLIGGVADSEGEQNE